MSLRSGDVDPASRASREDRIERFCLAHAGAVLFDRPGARVLDVFSGKSLPLPSAAFGQVVERKNTETGEPYLVLVRDDGRQIVLAPVGIAFEPLTASTGPIPDLPPVVCFRDLAAAEARLTHALLAHPEEEPNRSHVALMLFCLSVVDGARAVGFDVSTEERRLERLLGELEARRGG